ALQAARSSAVLRRDPVDAGAKEGAQAGAGRVESGQQVLLERVREEVLRQVGRLVVGLAPVQPQITVDGAPVRGGERGQGAPPRLRIAFADRRERRVSGRREATREVLFGV